VRPCLKEKKKEKGRKSTGCRRKWMKHVIRLKVENRVNYILIEIRNGKGLNEGSGKMMRISKRC
jgi:hypothetical protein